MTTIEKHTKFKLVSPEASIQLACNEVNSQPADLSGKTVLLYWNGKPNGDLFLNRIGELLTANVSALRVVKAWEVAPSSRHTEPNHSASRETAAMLAESKPDLVIGAPGDCAGCATWLVTDQMNIERLGIPTLTVVTSPFMELARSTSLAEGFRGACFIQVPPPIGMLPAQDVHVKAESVFDDILKAVAGRQASAATETERDPYPAEVFEFSGTVEDINSHFFERNWSLGLPVLPPTPERLCEMLNGTGRTPGEILGQVPPGMGTLTVELAAVYAAMAGCRPDYMPLLIAALEGFLDPNANARLALSGTGTSQLVVIVNGPIVKRLGIGCGQGAAGKGHHVNGSVGYAINLIAYGVGGSRPPNIDRSTLASPSDYVCWVFGENEDALPRGWKPLHEERGYKSTDNVVTVMAGYPPVENNDHWSGSIDEHLRWWRHIVSPLLNMGGASVPQVIELSPIIALGPEHAQLVVSEKWQKDDFRKAFWEQTRIPLSTWPSACDRKGLAEIMGPLGDEDLIPITLTPERFLVVIAGGDGKQSHFFAPFPGSFPVSRPVTY